MPPLKAVKSLHLFADDDDWLPFHNKTHQSTEVFQLCRSYAGSRILRECTFASSELRIFSSLHLSGPQLAQEALSSPHDTYGKSENTGCLYKLSTINLVWGPLKCTKSNFIPVHVFLHFKSFCLVVLQLILASKLSQL